MRATLEMKIFNFLETCFVKIKVNINDIFFSFRYSFYQAQDKDEQGQAY